MKIEVTKEKVKFKPIEIILTIEHETDLNQLKELFAESCDYVTCPENECEDCSILTLRELFRGL